jgi:hypothetical protein
MLPYTNPDTLEVKENFTDLRYKPYRLTSCALRVSLALWSASNGCSLIFTGISPLFLTSQRTSPTPPVRTKPKLTKGSN